jgi:hypothetical protein
VEPETRDRIQQMIDAEAAARFPEGAVPWLVLLRYGDHPVIEPGELYLKVILGKDSAARDAWMEEHGDRLEDFRAQRLPEVKGLVLTADDREAAGQRPTGIMKMDGISMLDPAEDEIARGLTPVDVQLGPADLQTLDALIIAGIAATRAEGARWALARAREQPAYVQLSQRGREPGPLKAAPGMERAMRDEPGDLLVRVLIEAAEEDPPLPAWERDHEAMINGTAGGHRLGPGPHPRAAGLRQAQRASTRASRPEG